jgi:hypothetical protein
MRFFLKTTAMTVSLTCALAMSAVAAPRAATLAPPVDAARLALQVTPTSQQLELEIDPLADRWNGSLRTELRVHQRLSRFSLALTGPLPSRVEMSDARGKVEVLWAVRGERVLIETRRELKPGRAILAIAFDGEWGQNGRGLQRTGEGRATRVIAQLGGSEAARVFPCWPGDPSTRWQLLVHTPAHWQVQARGLLPAAHEVQGRWHTTALKSKAALRASALTLEVTPAR